MRLIDVDDAIEKINGLCVDGNENWIGTENQSFVDHSEVIDILCDAPTVDAVEAVHGRWKEGYLIHKYGCSCCGTRQDMISPYCPNCGAKMDGEKGEGE